MFSSDMLTLHAKDAAEQVEAQAREAKRARREAKAQRAAEQAKAAAAAEKAAKAQEDAARERKERLAQIRRSLDRTRVWCDCGLRTGHHKDRCRLWTPYGQLTSPGADYDLSRADLAWFKAQGSADRTREI